MRTPIAGLVWEIWVRHRRLVWLIVGLLIFGAVFNAVLPDTFRATQSLREKLLTINCLLMLASVVLVFAAFNYTESSPQNESTGYPSRLFTLPVSTWWLAAVPIGLGVLCVEGVFWSWQKLVFVRQEIPMVGWLAVLVGCYLVFYQTTLWCLARFRIVRLLVLGLGGTSFIGIAALPCFYRYVPTPWLSEGRLSMVVATLSVGAFAVALKFLEVERTGGVRRRRLPREWLDYLREVVPQRRTAFRSAAAAQFWFEWHRSGWLLPTCVLAALVFVIGPIAWRLGHDPGSGVWLLGWTLAMPVILAGPIGKAFSKAEFWSPSVSMTAFDAVRPLATGELVAIKLKVAVLSAAIAWLFVLTFLCLWLPYADLSVLDPARIGYWMIYHHSTGPQYAIMALTIVAGMILTWRGLVQSLWLGLWGRRKWFQIVPAAYTVVLVAGLIGVLLLAKERESHSEGWSRNPNVILEWAQRLLAIAVIAKVWLAAWTWRHISPRRLLSYLLFWVVAVGCLAALVILIWGDGALVLLCGPLDPIRLRNTLLLGVLFIVPLARVGLAPLMLTQNRHEASSDGPNAT